MGMSQFGETGADVCALHPLISLQPESGNKSSTFALNVIITVHGELREGKSQTEQTRR